MGAHDTISGLRRLMDDIGKRGTIYIKGGLHIVVTVIDVKNTYGKDRWLVEPVSGHGTTWVETIDIPKPTKA